MRLSKTRLIAFEIQTPNYYTIAPHLFKHKLLISHKTKHMGISIQCEQDRRLEKQNKIVTIDSLRTQQTEQQMIKKDSF